MRVAERRRRAGEKAQRQEARRVSRYYEAESPMSMLKSFLPEASLNELARLRRDRQCRDRQCREPERRV